MEVNYLHLYKFYKHTLIYQKLSNNYLNLVFNKSSFQENMPKSKTIECKRSIETKLTNPTILDQTHIAPKYFIKKNENSKNFQVPSQNVYIKPFLRFKWLKKGPLSWYIIGRNLLSQKWKKKIQQTERKNCVSLEKTQNWATKPIKLTKIIWAE